MRGRSWIHAVAWAGLALAIGCKSESRATRAAACPATCSGAACNGCDPKVEHCDRSIVTGAVGVVRWPDPDIGPNRLDAAVHRTAACGGVKWPFATTHEVCGPFSTWLADADGNELPGTRYDSSTEVLQIFGNMWSGPVRACASVCGHSVCSPVDAP